MIRAIKTLQQGEQIRTNEGEQGSLAGRGDLGAESGAEQGHRLLVLTHESPAEAPLPIQVQN